MRDDNLLLDGYLDHLRVEKGLAARSVEAYAGDLVRFAVHVRQSGKTLGAVDNGDVAGWLVSLSQAGISARAQARKLSALRGFFKFLLQERMVTADPTALIQGPKLPRKLPHVLAFEEVELLLGAPDRESPRGLRDHGRSRRRRGALRADPRRPRRKRRQWAGGGARPLR